MLATVAKAFSVPEIRRKLLFVAGILALYRLGAYIPVPGVNIDAIDSLEDSLTGSDILGFLNLFSGGSLSRLSLFALGIMPYITASIILQLMTVVLPSLERLQKEGEVGQQKITQYTRYLTVALAAMQSFAYVFLFNSLAPAGGESVIRSLALPNVFLMVILVFQLTSLVLESLILRTLTISWHRTMYLKLLKI